MTTPIEQGITPWPPSAAAEYVEKGYWAGENLADRIWRRADSHPEAIAVSDADERLSYADLCRSADAMASGFAGMGLAPGDRIILQLPNSAIFAVAVFACIRCGVVPIMALPAHRSLELRHMIEIAEAKAIVVADEVRGFDHQSMALELMSECPSVQHVLVAGPSVESPSIDLRSLARSTNPADDRLRWDAAVPESHAVALFLLSGGTTGMPKLIPRTHDDYLYNARASAEVCQLDDSTVYLSVLPASHNFPLACPGLIGTLLNGGRVVMLPSPEPERVFHTIKEEGVTITAVVPAIVLRWLAFRREHPDGGGTTLKVVQVGGARIADDVAREIKPVLGCTLQQVFGMAEGLLNYTRLDDADDVICTTQGRPLSPADEVRIVDADDRDLPDGVAGLLLTRGPYTPRGYYRALEQNLRSFTADGWYRSGDIVRRRADGNLVVEGREKDMINRGGEKISAEDVENLTYGIAEVALVAAVGMPDPELGERVCLYIVPRHQDASITLEMVRSNMEAAGAARHAWPERVEIVSELPTTKVGKIDKAALRNDIVERLLAEQAMSS